MSTQTTLSFAAPTLNTDNLPLTEPLTYTAYIDTVNPPVKSFAVPAANIAAAVAGIITATFAQLGFTPVKNVDYFVDVTATDADGTSAPSAIVQFAYSVAPKGPTGLKVF
jgi:hypothetical protein